MRGAIVLLGFASLGVGCGGAGTAREGERIDLAPRPEVGVRYQILHRQTLQISGRRAIQIQTRTLLEVTAVSADGTRRMRARVFRTVGEGARDERVLDEIATLTVSAEGVVLGDPHPRCGSGDELRVGRYLRHLLGARAFVARRVREGSRWRGDYLSDAIEDASPATFRLDEIGRRAARGRIRARIEVDNGDIGPARISGRGRVRGRFSVSLADGFAGRTELQTTIEGTLWIDGARRRGRVRTRSRIHVRRLARRPAYELSCAAPFDVARIRTQIREHRRQIQACREQVPTDGEARGSVLVRFAVRIDGRVRGAQVQANDTGSAELAECVVRALSALRFDPQPRRGDGVTITHRFRFAPPR